MTTADFSLPNLEFSTPESSRYHFLTIHKLPAVKAVLPNGIFMLTAFCLFKYFPYGGLQRDFLRIAKEIYRRGHSVRVYVQSWQGAKPEGFDIIEVKTYSSTNHGRTKEFTTFVQQHLANHPADVVVGFNKMPGLDVYYAADVCYEEKVQQEKHSLSALFYRLTPRYKHFSNYEKATFGRNGCPHLMMISDVEMRYYAKHYGTEAKRFTLLPPGIAKDRKYSPKQIELRTEFRQKNNISDDQFVLLQLGSDFKRKGVDRSLRAIASLPGEIRDKVVCLVVGQDNPKASEALAKELDLTAAQVRFLGGRDDVPSVLAASDVFLHPAYHENTGTVILEALVAGIPIIVSGICGYAHYVAEAKCGTALKEPFDQDEMNHALCKLLTNENYRHECAENAKNFADTEDLYSMIERAADIIECAAKPH